MSKSTGETIGKIIAGTGLAAALTAGITAAVAELFTQIAIDREEPELLKKIMNSITGGSADTTEEDQQLLDEMRRELADNIVERIEISARDGSILVGHWFQTLGEKMTAVFFMPSSAVRGKAAVTISVSASLSVMTVLTGFTISPKIKATACLCIP